MPPFPATLAARLRKRKQDAPRLSGSWPCGSEHKSRPLPQHPPWDAPAHSVLVIVEEVIQSSRELPLEDGDAQVLRSAALKMGQHVSVEPA